MNLLDKPMNIPLFQEPTGWTAPNMNDLPDWEGCKRVGLDIETRDCGIGTDRGVGTRYHGSFICGVSFALEDGEAYYLPIQHEGGGNLDKAMVYQYLLAQSNNFTGEIVGANLTYDLDYLAEWGITFPKVKMFRDVQIAAPLIYELENFYSLQAIAERLGIPAKDETALKESASNWGIDPKSDMWRLPADCVGEYAEQDARLPLQIMRRQEQVINDLGLQKIFDLESRVQPVLLGMTRRGIRVNEDKLAWIDQWSKSQQQSCLDEVKRLTGVGLGIGDCTTASAVVPILEKLGTLVETTATGKPKTDKATLESIDHPAIKHLLRARRFDKITTMYVEPTIRHLVKGRVHPNYHQLRRQREDKSMSVGGTISGRLSCSNPNIQQQPSRDPEIAPIWRSIYLPDKELLACADYSQQEPRILVHYAELVGARGSKEAGDKYRNDPNTDFHSMMSDITGLDRKTAKAVFLGMCYGMGLPKLCDELGLPTKTEARNGKVIRVAGHEGMQIKDQFTESAPFVEALNRQVQNKASREGYITTLCGRRRNFPRKETGGYDWTHKALNALIQGSAADQTKTAMLKLADAGFDLQLQVHDEVGLSVDSVEEGRQVKEIMENATPEMTVPSRVDLEIGPHWGAVEEVE